MLLQNAVFGLEKILYPLCTGEIKCSFLSLYDSINKCVKYTRGTDARPRLEFILEKQTLCATQQHKVQQNSLTFRWNNPDA